MQREGHEFVSLAVYKQTTNDIKKDKKSPFHRITNQIANHSTLYQLLPFHHILTLPSQWLNDLHLQNRLN